MMETPRIVKMDAATFEEYCEEMDRRGDEWIFCSSSTDPSMVGEWYCTKRRRSRADMKKWLKKCTKILKCVRKRVEEHSVRCLNVYGCNLVREGHMGVNFVAGQTLFHYNAMLYYDTIDKELTYRMSLEMERHRRRYDFSRWRRWLNLEPMLPGLQDIADDDAHDESNTHT